MRFLHESLSYNSSTASTMGNTRELSKLMSYFLAVVINKIFFLIDPLILIERLNVSNKGGCSS